MTDYREAAAQIAAALPVHEPEFPIPIGIVDGYRNMTAGELSATIETGGVPGAAAQLGRMIIHGYAGSGKTELMHRVFRTIVDGGGYATLVRLRNLAGLSAAWDELRNSPPAQIGLLLSDVAQPPVDEAFMREIGEPFHLMVDGLDEIPSSLAGSVLRALDDLAARVPNVVVVVTDRFTYRPIDPYRWTIATLRPLGLPDAEQLLHKDLDQLPPLLRVPVFADLVVQGRVDAAVAPTDQRTMISFIRPYLVGEIGDEMLPALADAAYDVYATSQSRVFPLEQFAAIAGADATQAVIDAEVVMVDGPNASFARNLVHDYLAAYSLASHRDRWTQEGFDAVSFKASSFDVLVLAAEVLADGGDGEPIEVFVQQLYDWNFYAVGFVLARCVSIDSDALPPEVYTAVETMLAERRWDLVKSTAGRVEDALRLIGNDIAEQLLALGSLSDLQAWVATQPGSAPWFEQWRQLFLTPQGVDVDVDFVSAVQDTLSIRGWTAANVVKRTHPTDAAESQLREFVIDRTDELGAVRWRAAHALGAFPTPANAEVLLYALNDDPYPWARYGAIRSLIEQAARAEDPAMRSTIIENLTAVSDAIASQPLLVGELSNCVVVTDPPDGWAEALRPLLGAMWAKSSGEEQQLWDRTASSLAADTTEVA